MKKFISLILTTLVCINSLADSRTVADAKAIASSFGRNISANTRALSLDEPTLAFTGKKNLQNLYYVFNYGEEAFVIVAADERATTILAYSDNGSFSMEKLPDGARWMLNEYDKALDKLANSDYQPEQTRATRATSIIEPLLGDINFDQEEPYNNLFPQVGNLNCVTGCMATAIATIAAYHKYPEQGQGKVSYKWSEKTLEYDYDANPFDWNNILPTYNGSETEEQINAVGNLMLACSYGLQSNLGTINQGGTGATIEHLAELLFDHLKYDKGAILRQRYLYSTADWMASIDEDLENQRPVFYMGFTQQNAGHAFVLDGRDENGLYHFNWGWGGHSNGYFTLDPVTGLAPSSQGAGGGEGGFGQGQIIVTGLQPDKGNTAEPGLFVGMLYDDQNTISYGVYNYGFGKYNGEIGLGVFDEEGNLIETKFVNKVTDGLDYLYGIKDSRPDSEFQYDLALIWPVMRPKGQEEFEPIPIPLNLPQGIVVEKNEEGELVYGSHLPILNYLTLDNFELVGKAYDKESAEFSVTLTNHHETEDLFGSFAIYIEHSRTKKYQMFTNYMLEVSLQPGETKTFIIDTVEKFNIGNGGATASVLYCDDTYLYMFGKEDIEKDASIEIYVNKAVTGDPELYLTSLAIVNNASRQIHYGDQFVFRIKVDNKGSYGKLETAVFVFEEGKNESVDYQCVKERCYYQGSNTIEFEMNLTNLDVNKKYLLVPAYVKPKASYFDWFATENGKANHIVVELLPALANAIDAVNAEDSNRWWVEDSRLNVKIASEEGTIDIYRLDGSLVATDQLPCGFSIIDISPVPQGMYIVKITDGDTHIEGKFVK